MRFRLIFSLLVIVCLFASALSQLVISKAERRIDLTSQIIRVSSSLKVENVSPEIVTEILLSIPDNQAKNLAFLLASISSKGKLKVPTVSLPIKVTEPNGMPPELTFYSISLPKELREGESVTLDVFAAFTHSLRPFPEEITQADTQLVLFQESACYLSPYKVKTQTLTVKLPSSRVESYTKTPDVKLVDSEIRYGPYKNLPPFSYTPIIIHFENNRPFSVAQELVREIEISHWGNVQVAEHYTLVHAGAQNKGGFSRIDYQTRHNVRGSSSFRSLTARLPPRAHSVYYRDEIGNISTSHLWGDTRKTELEIEPRYPMFGGWRTSFTIGYGLPLQDFLFEADGSRYLNFSFGCPINDIVINNLIVKVVLPEGSKDISIAVPFPIKQWREVKYSHLDLVGRPVVVIKKDNVVPEHNMPFQVYYNFNNLSLLREPLMLVFGFFFFFIACVVYIHADMSISKSSPSYLAKLQWDEIQATIQQIQTIIGRCLSIQDKLESSLSDLSRTGDIQACKSARKVGDNLLKEQAKDLKPLLRLLQSSPAAIHLWLKVEQIVAKEKEMQEKLMLRHTTAVDLYEKKLNGREIEDRIAPYQQKISALRLEVVELLEAIDVF